MSVQYAAVLDEIESKKKIDDDIKVELEKAIKTKQLDSATFDILPRLDSGEEVGEDWILRYKLSLDNYEQSTTPTYSELLIGIFDSKNSAITNQWGIGTAFLNGANMKYTNCCTIIQL